VPRIEVVRKKGLAEGRSSPGILREKAFEADGILVARSTVGGGVVSAWHHHGQRHLYGFLISGHMKLEFGPKGKEAVELNPGDYFSIPAGLIHRDVNLSKERKVLITNILVGGGPVVVDVKGPER
jgi:uncharacterized RmlC-like cupin family protein